MQNNGHNVKLVLSSLLILPFELIEDTYVQSRLW